MIEQPEREDLDKDWIRLRVLEAVLARLDDWSIDLPAHVVGKALNVAIPLTAWVETGEDPRITKETP
jgi:hypothetical protein